MLATIFPCSTASATPQRWTIGKRLDRQVATKLFYVAGGLDSKAPTPRILRVAGGFLDELHARGQPEFGVDVGEVGLHGAR